MRSPLLIAEKAADVADPAAEPIASTVALLSAMAPWSVSEPAFASVSAACLLRNSRAVFNRFPASRASLARPMAAAPAAALAAAVA